jgi:hypothetical protein
MAFRTICTLVFCTISFFTFSQEVSIDEWNSPKYRPANSAATVDYMNDVEKEVVRLMNCARMDGKLFARTYLIRYMQGYNVSKTNYLSTLINALENIPPGKPLIPSSGLTKSARDHAKDLGENGKMGHVGTDGSKMANRIERYTEWGDIIAENCSYGTKTALDIVCTLLIDEGVVTYGHRKNILSAEHNVVGVATAPHTAYKWDCVMDFAGSIIKEK